MTMTSGRFTETAMTNAMRKIAGDLHIPSDGARLLRLTNNAVFALPDVGLVIRVARSHGLHDRVHKLARLGAWFTDIDAPTIRLAHGHEQPFTVDGLLATIWTYVPTCLPEPTVHDLGHVLRQFHALGSPTFDLPAWDPIGDARRRIVDAEALNNSDRKVLLQWCDQLAPRVARLNAQAAGGLIHADAHIGNLLRESPDRVVLCDFDATCTGPWQVDLAAVAVGESRFGRTGAHAGLAAAYGYDITTDPDWPTFREARELKMVAAAVPLLASSPYVAEQFQIRLQSIINDGPDIRWTPFADLRQPEQREA
ncbi:phosphotransferase enzyme family protein [Dactylosporangium siamense]|uniref:Aminoglycoside phosphotransferase n=1 Tax=Dactylosporangium siamense TaxID=685454 RepID=A0A919PY27_9ACTN|nr:aminoglycoside phosphotransferase family protein [Dactylosporangium siamense]GIG52875.1 aminoglycoside phosphotransferase [Dactylosporangium siamense]